MNTWFEAGHVALVTGGSRGLGKHLARELVSRGVHTIVDGRDPRALETAQAELAALGPVTALAGDVSDDEHVHALVAEARRLGRLDLVINNASTLGRTPLPPLEALDRETFGRIFDVNVYAPLHLIRHALPLLRAGSPATVVNVSSDAAVAAYPGWGGYGASKAALELLSRVLVKELAGSGVRVLVADPGDMDTDLHRAAVPDAEPSELRDPADSARALLAAVANLHDDYERVAVADLAPPAAVPA